jgi:hypothetical protein
VLRAGGAFVNTYIPARQIRTDWTNSKDNSPASENSEFTASAPEALFDNSSRYQRDFLALAES